MPDDAVPEPGVETDLESWIGLGDDRYWRGGNAVGGGDGLAADAGVAVYGRPDGVFMHSIVGWVPYTRWYDELPVSPSAPAGAPRVASGPGPDAATVVWPQQDDSGVRAFAASVRFGPVGGWPDTGSATAARAISGAEPRDLVLAAGSPVVAAWTEGDGIRIPTGSPRPAARGPEAVPGGTEGRHPALAFDGYGNGVVVGAGPDGTRATGLDGEPPLLEAGVETLTPAAGQPVAYAAAVVDVWSPPGPSTSAGTSETARRLAASRARTSTPRRAPTTPPSPPPMAPGTSRAAPRTWSWPGRPRVL